jgi:hypothetical protein
MMIRKDVVEAYDKKVQTDTRRAFLDHRGQDLLYGADNDIACTACELGLGKGVFPGIWLTHLIPDSRCTWDYFSRSVEGRILSGFVKDFLETGRRPGRPSVRETLSLLRCMLTPDPFVRVSALARRRGRCRAARLLSGGDNLDIYSQNSLDAHGVRRAERP